MRARPRSHLIRVLGIALALLLVGHAQSASAAIAGLERHQAFTPVASEDTKVTVSCPPGKQVLGGGADTIGGSNVAINDVVPDATLSAITAAADEDATGTTNNWFMRAYANCAPPPPGLERIVATSPDDSLNKTVTAACPAGKSVLGAGGEISVDGGQVVLEDIRVNSLASVTAQGIEAQGGTTSNWYVSAYAICAIPVAGLQRVAATSPSNSSNKSATATCPAGKHVLGAGTEISGGGGQVVVADLTPTIPLLGGPAASQVFANAEEDEDGTAANWTVRAIAICGATSLRRVVQSVNDSNNKPVMTANCGAGRQVTGGGFDLIGGAGEVLVPELVPSTTSFAVNAFEDEDGFAGNWFLRAYAICAPPLPGQEIVSATSPDDSNNKAVTVPCPVGKRVIGTGATVLGAPAQIILDGIVPDTALTGVTANAVEDETGTNGNWQLRAFAICATPPPGLELVTIAGEDPDSDPSSVTASCPVGKSLLGTGAEIVGADGQVALDDLRPSAAVRSVTVTGLEDDTGTALQWLLRAHAICANP